MVDDRVNDEPTCEIEESATGQQEESEVLPHSPVDAIEDKLDMLALKRLELLDITLKKKQVLAEYMKTGYFQLGKARYALGCHAVSALRIPDSFITATMKSSCHSEPLEDTEASYTARRVTAAMPCSENKLSKDDIEEMSEQVSKLEVDCTPSITTDNDVGDECKVASKKPIEWFSALPPQSLRHAQSSFDASLQLVATCVSLQAQLLTLDQQYNNLMEHKMRIS